MAAVTNRPEVLAGVCLNALCKAVRVGRSRTLRMERLLTRQQQEWEKQKLKQDMRNNKKKQNKKQKVVQHNYYFANVGALNKCLMGPRAYAGAPFALTCPENTHSGSHASLSSPSAGGWMD